MQCPKCQAENPEGVKFCGECGASLSSELTCPRCGHKNPNGIKFCHECGYRLSEHTPSGPATSKPVPPTPSVPTASGPFSTPEAFANGRYQVKKFLGEGGKKKVFLAHDKELDRDVAIYLIKTEKLDDAGRTRIKREAQAMARLGDHPNIASIHDYGDHDGQPYMVAPLLSGGDVEGLIKKAPDHKLPLDKTLEIAKSVCKGLEFAHSKGIIHRDIKPGNVMLAADGTAKVNDFGLAVAVDLSRLTQAGMMVGTVSYMPPEQAMGGNVTAKADLYSLGAMLYEMVTGRPPFVGDDHIAIIGQHINTPPVSPSWHRADLPPSLETLIMQLLEKDPEKRPASAKVVLQALESIGTGKVKEPSQEAAPPAENPLYRRVTFVGRERELQQLQSAFDGAMSGQGALMMVLGEPGIGKTALCDRLSTYVSLKGGRTLVGHCYEEGSLSLPYLAFVEAMRSYVLDRDIDDLKKELGSGVTDVARIVSEIREKLDIKPRAAESPEEDRYRLMQSVSSFLIHAAAVKPMLVVLEDLHDADKGTLDMLTYVSRNLGGSRLLVVGTYRDVEVDRAHPLSAALAELRRVSTFGRVILRGLNADEVRRMLESITQESVPWSLAEAVHRQTEGNPLFVQEVVRYLTEQKLLVSAGGKMTATGSTPLEMNIPEGLRDVIGKRLSNLSDGCNQLLTVASVIGREFVLDILKAVADISEDVFVNALKEAIQLSILEDRSQVGVMRYRFTHAFFRQTLYEELITPERLKLHQKVARSMEQLYKKRLDEHAAELAEHFSQSNDTTDLRKAIEYGEMAAKRAADVYAYGEAVRLLDSALRVQRVLDPDNKEKICDLLLALCEALLQIPEPKRVYDVEAPAAFSLAEALADSSRAVRACVAAILAIVDEQWISGIVGSRFSEWVQRGSQYARPGTSERALINPMLGLIKVEKDGDVGEGVRLTTEGYNLARDLGDRTAVHFAGTILLSNRRSPQHATDNVGVASELWASLHSGRSFSSESALFRIADAYLVVGQRRRAEDAVEELKVLAKLTAKVRAELMAMACDSLFAAMDGRFDDAMKTAEDVRVRGVAAGVTGTAEAFSSTSDFRVRLYLGEKVDLAFLSERTFEARLFNCLTQAHLGRKEEAVKMIDRFVMSRPAVGTLQDEWPIFIDNVFLEASVLVGYSQAAEILLGRFNVHGADVSTSGFQWLTCVARHLGAGAAVLGRYDEARRHYQEAIRVCTEMRFRPELALTRLQLAELLLEHYPDEKKEALDHLDFAIKEFREMKMRPSLERALRHKEILKA